MRVQRIPIDATTIPIRQQRPEDSFSIMIVNASTGAGIARSPLQSVLLDAQIQASGARPVHQPNQWVGHSLSLNPPTGLGVVAIGVRGGWSAVV